MFFQSKVLQSLSILRHVQHLFYFQKKIKFIHEYDYYIIIPVIVCWGSFQRGKYYSLYDKSPNTSHCKASRWVILSILPSMTAVIQYARYKHLWIYVVNRSREPWISIRPGPDPALTQGYNWNHQSIQYPTHNTRACLRLRCCEYMYIVFVFAFVVFVVFVVVVVVVVVVERGVLCVMRVNAGTIDYVRIDVRMY